MTQGKEPEWADTPYAQWIRGRLDELGWNKKRLAAELLKADREKRLGQAGADGLVTRATKRGVTPLAANRALMVRVLGPEPLDRPEEVEERVARLERALAKLGPDLEALETLPGRVLALEQRDQSKTGRGRR